MEGLVCTVDMHEAQRLLHLVIDVTQSALF